jgi:hypothetical protein
MVSKRLNINIPERAERGWQMGLYLHKTRTFWEWVKGDTGELTQSTQNMVSADPLSPVFLFEGKIKELPT